MPRMELPKIAELQTNAATTTVTITFNEVISKNSIEDREPTALFTVVWADDVELNNKEYSIDILVRGISAD